MSTSVVDALRKLKLALTNWFSQAWRSFQKRMTGPMPVVLQPIRDLSDPRLDEAVQVLVAAFKENEVARAMIGGRERLRTMMHTAVVRATVVGGQLWIALDESDRVVGTASWYPPGSDFLDDDAQFNEGFAQFFAELQKVDPAVYDWWFTGLLPKYRESSKKYFSTPEDPEGGKFRKDNWNLVSFSVIPDLQRRGIGRQLLKVGEDKAKEQHKSCCLETSTDENLKMYERLGYRLLGMEHVDGPPGHPGYDQRILIKDP
ncbi:hypothetical protein OE88DRAFT_997628 [Heliocybe sulcata]|uniref:N-acetyltransferase domain-containing protein n=1 Tax=Heliocybe sulcata TaxID=5364 RepID=A0A5C3NDY0_9AGAM|nr:hypothetical protein OE88DRAFT_997628 [Heliocybe sulcata]